MKLAYPYYGNYIFQSTLSLRRATTLNFRSPISVGISIHALLAESDLLTGVGAGSSWGFQSTLSLRRATVTRPSIWMVSLNFNPRSPCGERPSSARTGWMISADFNPRSPCGERHKRGTFAKYVLGISIHALLAESDIERREIMSTNDLFQSTLSLRRATWPGVPPVGFSKFQSTLSLRRATSLDVFGVSTPDNFNPRSPCGERQRSPRSRTLSIMNFNPRSPCGERQQIPPNWPYRFCLKCQFKDGEKSKKAKGSASAQASSPAYEKNKVRIPWGDFECFRFAPIK